MGQLFRIKNCPTCGNQMVKALPPGGKRPRVLTCLDCDGKDPLTDTTTSGWLKGELGQISDLDVEASADDS
ncbi:hypothetical protein [Nitrobacter sp.]|jgi:hypothetical protein|uniref:hypothetical protein n=1 Tax=Nitrobacter sp. TaxID=29420 RepID=UPI0029CAC54C|nr:hypothetical protein [Nitrobacter sp.]